MTLKYSYATLLTSDSYLPGALVLAHALRESGTSHSLSCIVTPETLSATAIPILRRVFDHVAIVPVLRSGDPERLGLLGRPELDVTFTKIHLWNPEVMPFDKVVFLDADTLPLRNVDELFEYVSGDVAFAAAPDQGWPDCFNSGVFVLKPDAAVHVALQSHAEAQGSFDGGDQGLLNTFFSTWSGVTAPTDHPTPPTSTRLPFIFNVTPTAIYSYLPAFVHYRTNIAIVHFIGEFKPWMYDRFTDGSVVPRGHSVPQTLEVVQKWWTIFDTYSISGQLNQVHTLRGRFSGWNFKPVNFPYQMPVSALPPRPTTPLPSSLTSAEEPQAPTDFGSYRVDWDSREFTRRQKRLTDGSKIGKLTIDSDEPTDEVSKVLGSPLSATPLSVASGRKSPGGGGAGAMSPLAATTPTSSSFGAAQAAFSSSAPLPAGFGTPKKASSPNLSTKARETAGARASPPSSRK
ncbi:hypothetical protein SmJEL517_g02547 [Synchytrium microbalum]|uniref:glycogenin glucosyltransferase n=1 Tax=Synchytrium microbalum TaxID=1806994 RepID=A0A507CBG5_9FUNG|nr:uncharacterized protein SmJEL517_g02547 [Synchytrium microbalum]TPX34895.1 hypothetical protein SmJEL517_g02547 [Synchytrium microbalum]